MFEKLVILIIQAEAVASFACYQRKMLFIEVSNIYYWTLFLRVPLALENLEIRFSIPRSAEVLESHKSLKCTGMS